MKLYYAPGACSLATHIVLRETDATFELEKIDTQRHLTADGGDFFAINSKGQVPLLEVAKDVYLSEGPVIAQYLAELAGSHRLLPPVGLPRYRVLEWQNFVGTELHKAYTPIFSPGLDDAAKAILRGRLRKKYEWLEAQLPAQGYLTGDEFTVADAYLFTVTQWATYVTLDLDDLPRLHAYLGRVAARPAVQAALKAEGLLR
ncbi:glutathione transferase GstA [Thermomonas fusca]|uniref:Glutathione transferase GstA n=1 Tax=Thermomonas fusca TaxID=215690 RepID=A0A5R9PJ79_9GAMM|nr:glutathione transferase GstA [Thermomonas fusca]TLX22798.1 glutathione transferase GstA [Thermomonas fusca]